VGVISKAFLKSETDMKVTESRKHFIRTERYSLLLGNVLFANALNSIYTLIFMLNTVDKLY
jgi:hypothetical protein